MKDINSLALVSSPSEIIENWEILEQLRTSPELETEDFVEQFTALERRQAVIVYQAQQLLAEKRDYQLFLLFKRSGLPVTFSRLRKMMKITGTILLVTLGLWFIIKGIAKLCEPDEPEPLPTLTEQYEATKAHLANVKSSTSDWGKPSDHEINHVNSDIAAFNARLKTSSESEKTGMTQIEYFVR